MQERWLSSALKQLETANLTADQRMQLELDIAYRVTYEEDLKAEGRQQGEAQGIEIGVARGRSEGKKEGKSEGRNETKLVFKALKAGETPEAVAAKYGLALEEVLDLKETFGL